MIKANELRIGNYVFSDSDEKHIHIIEWHNLGLEEIPFDPIPLTYELLDLISIKKVPNPYYKDNHMFTEMYVLDEERFMDENSLVVEDRIVKSVGHIWYVYYIIAGIYETATDIRMGKEPTESALRSVKVKYLHEVQNLYFSLTSKELEINFHVATSH